MKVLIIEDEILILKSLSLLIKKKGHVVEATTSGHEAIKLILSENFDIIICDLMLQDISGFDIIEDSKRKLSSLDIKNKFRIMTAYSSPQVLDKANEYGCVVLTKPFQDITKAINLMLEVKNV